MVLETSGHAQGSLARLQAKDPKSTTPASAQKGVGESSSHIPREEG